MRQGADIESISRAQSAGLIEGNASAHSTTNHRRISRAQSAGLIEGALRLFVGSVGQSFPAHKARASLKG